MNIESNRLYTFERWEVPFIDKNVLARFGFYYTGDPTPDTVTCYFCDINIGQWEDGDDILEHHKRFSPNCSLIKKRPNDNIPIDADLLHTGTGACDCDCWFCNRYEFPEYMSDATRVASYKEWSSEKQNILALSEAGFFYMGKNDQVICFCCGGGLKGWEENDDPWERHSKFFKQCRYLKLVRPFERLKTVEESRICKICYEWEYNTAFSPCGHVICGKCASGVDKCPMCLVTFDRLVSLYI